MVADSCLAITCKLSPDVSTLYTTGRASITPTGLLLLPAHWPPPGLTLVLTPAILTVTTSTLRALIPAILTVLTLTMRALTTSILTSLTSTLRILTTAWLHQH